MKIKLAELKNFELKFCASLGKTILKQLENSNYLNLGITDASELTYNYDEKKKTLSISCDCSADCPDPHQIICYGTLDAREVWGLSSNIEFYNPVLKLQNGSRRSLMKYIETYFG
jgi:hypothetical protein